MDQEGIKKSIDFLFYMPIVTIMSKQPGSRQFRVEQSQDGLAVDTERRSVELVKQNLKLGISGYAGILLLPQLQG